MRYTLNLKRIIVFTEIMKRKKIHIKKIHIYLVTVWYVIFFLQIFVKKPQRAQINVPKISNYFLFQWRVPSITTSGSDVPLSATEATRLIGLLNILSQVDRWVNFCGTAVLSYGAGISGCIRDSQTMPQTAGNIHAKKFTAP